MDMCEHVCRGQKTDIISFPLSFPPFFLSPQTMSLNGLELAEKAMLIAHGCQRSIFLCFPNSGITKVHPTNPPLQAFYIGPGGQTQALTLTWPTLYHPSCVPSPPPRVPMSCWQNTYNWRGKMNLILRKSHFFIGSMKSYVCESNLRNQAPGLFIGAESRSLFNKTQHKQLAACSGCPRLWSVRVSTSALSDLAIVPDKGPQDLIGNLKNENVTLSSNFAMSPNLGCNCWQNR